MVRDKRKLHKTQMNISDKKVVKRSTIKAFIPDELVNIILLYLPADILYSVMRRVCKQWYNIINSPTFIYSHLQNLTHGQLVKVDKKKKMNYPFVEKICASCNGLVLVVGPIAHSGFTSSYSYVANPITKQYLPLPVFLGTLDKRCCFTYTSASRVYKIFSHARPKYLIISVGVDKAWREVDMSQLTPIERELLFSSPARLLRGFSYWICKSFPFILRFDMENETFTQIPLPQSYENRVTGVIQINSSICLWVNVEKYVCELCLMMIDPETQHVQWEKLCSVNLSGRPSQNLLSCITEYFPCDDTCPTFDLSKNKELLVRKILQRFVINDVNTGVFGELRKFDECSEIESLVPLNNLPLCKSRRFKQVGPYTKEYMRAEFEEQPTYGF